MAGKKKEEVKLENNVTEGVMLTPELLAQLTAQITEQVKASMSVENKKVEKKEVVDDGFFGRDPRSKVKVVSNFYGTVGVYNSLGRYKVWKECGSTVMLSVEDLVDIESLQPTMFTDGYLTIDDEEITEALGLTDVKETIDKVKNLEEFLKSDIKEIDRVLDKLPTAIKENVITGAVNMVREDRIDSNRLIRLLENKLGIELQ